ncbi:MAG: hypothetical protein ACTSVL_06335 [Promethearchaeota archaeon]
MELIHEKHTLNNKLQSNVPIVNVKQGGIHYNKNLIDLVDTLLNLNSKLSAHQDLHEGNILYDGQRIVLIDPGKPSSFDLLDDFSISDYNRNFPKKYESIKI